MKKSSIPLFIAAFLFPYIQVIIGMNTYNFIYNSFPLSLYIILLILSVILNRFAVKKLLPYCILTANLSVCSFLSIFIVFTGEIGYDYKLLDISVAILSVICVIALSVAAWIFLNIFNKAFEAKRNKISADLYEPGKNREGNTLSIISFVLMFLSFIAVLAMAYIGGKAYNEYLTSYAFLSEEAYSYALKVIIIFVVTVLVLQILGFIFSYLATSKGCSNYKIALTARFSLFLFFILLGTVLVIIPLIEPISRIVQFTILKI